VKEELLELLRELERRIVPPPGCHHSITRAEYGSDADGWEERLALQVWLPTSTRIFFLDDRDFEKPVGDLVGEVIELAEAKT
jgi:hypothetical protein